jgi:regulation of enolase protein 1 (concanavalin A-like superfamily)
MSTATTTTTIEPFKLSAPPGTDIWRKAPSHNAFNASTHPGKLPTYDLKTFQRARLTFALPPADQLRQYDQAGILLHITRPGVPDNQTKWIKSGIEFYQGRPYVATVGCDAWADWSLTPMPNSKRRPSVTIETRRERDALGKSLWVYWIRKDDQGKEIERLPIREVNWVFADEEGWNVGVAGYVCRPTKLVESGDEELLEVEFSEGLEIEILKGE